MQKINGNEKDSRRMIAFFFKYLKTQFTNSRYINKNFGQLYLK